MNDKELEIRLKEIHSEANKELIIFFVLLIAGVALGWAIGGLFIH